MDRLPGDQEPLATHLEYLIELDGLVNTIDDRGRGKDVNLSLIAWELLGFCFPPAESDLQGLLPPAHRRYRDRPLFAPSCIITSSNRNDIGAFLVDVNKASVFGFRGGAQLDGELPSRGDSPSRHLGVARISHRDDPQDRLTIGSQGERQKPSKTTEEHES